MSKISEKIENFDSLPIRTRLIITFALVLFLFLFFEFLWYSPTDAKNKQLKTNIDNVDKQINELNVKQSDFNAGIFNKKQNPKYEELTRLEKQSTAIEKQLEDKTLTLVKPQDMANLLKQIIKSSEQLKLLSLTKEKPELLFTNMYRHPIKMVFEGNYLDTQDFINKLENMEKKVSFDSFNFSVEKYPKSKVTLTVSTYGMNRKWIGG